MDFISEYNATITLSPRSCATANIMRVDNVMTKSVDKILSILHFLLLFSTTAALEKGKNYIFGQKMVNFENVIKKPQQNKY